MADGRSARTQRRNAQRTRTMGGHPASQPPGPSFRRPRVGQQGQLPGMETAEAAPGPSEQQTLPFAGAEHVGPAANIPYGPHLPPPPAFAAKGIGKYINNGQFNKPAIKNAAQNIVRAHSDALHFRRTGFGEALRYTLGMESTPSHYTDYMNSRQRASLQSQYPQPVQVQHQPWSGWEQ